MKTRVLLIEDDKVDQMAFQRKMEAENGKFEITVAGSIADGKKLLSTHQYDIVLIDFFLSDGTAFDVFDSVMNAPYIVITGENKADIAVEAIKSGAADYLVKDLNRSYLTLLPTVIQRTINEHQMNEQFALLSKAMTAIKDSVYITNEDKEIVYVNGAFLKTYGYADAEEIIGQKDSVLFDEQHASEDIRHRRKDGGTFPVSISLSTVSNGLRKRSYHIAVVHDISEQKRMEESLIQAIEKFSQLLDIQTDKTALLEKNKKDIEKNYNDLKETYQSLKRQAA